MKGSALQNWNHFLYFIILDNSYSKNHTMLYNAQTVAQHYPHYKQNSHTVHSANKNILMQVQNETGLE